jgi:hypothetical protein
MMGWTAPALAAGAPGMATVVSVKGKARCSDDNKTWRTVKKDENLMPGCLIQTGPKSTVELVLGAWTPGPRSISLDGRHGDDTGEPAADALRVSENAVVAIDRMGDGVARAGRAEETQLDLRAGQIAGSVGKLAAASKYEIKLPSGVAGIRASTRYVISSSGVVSVNSGSVVIVEAVSGSSALATRVVTAGHRFDPQTALITEGSADAASLNPVKLDEGPSRSPTPAAPALNFQRSLPSRQF